ncbi:hypothetical protein, partial [Streptosporangium sandarakinum]|uniref:hypothetical protein n=1 Tax=Streptosporangium sandarakinum TaxID=1260955 RepID=UPI00339EFB40
MTAGTTLPLLRGGRRYASRDSVPVPGPAGTEIALSLAPEIMIRDDAARLRAARDGLPPLPAAERVALLREATRLFRHGRVPVPGLGEQDPGGGRGRRAVRHERHGEYPGRQGPGERRHARR